MTTAPYLTICIPTYQRRESVVARVAELCELPADLPVTFLVIDNASDDGTFEELTSGFADDRLVVLRNDVNLGFAGNLFALIAAARSDLVMFVSDEDVVHEAGLRGLIDFCRASPRRFVSPNAQVGANARYRGRDTTRPILAEEFESAAFYISGLTFDRAFAREAAAHVSALVPENSAATVYPQVLLSALAVAAGDSWFLDVLVTEQVESRETHIVDPASTRYYGVVGRWSQLLGYEAFFEWLSSSGSDEAATDAMRESYRRRFRSRLTDAVVREVPELAPHFAVAAPPVPIHRRLIARIRRAFPARP